MVVTVRFSGNAADITSRMIPVNIFNRGRKDEIVKDWGMSIA